jgi:hypothetical protein
MAWMIIPKCFPHFDSRQWEHTQPGRGKSAQTHADSESPLKLKKIVKMYNIFIFYIFFKKKEEKKGD